MEGMQDRQGQGSALDPQRAGGPLIPMTGLYNGLKKLRAAAPLTPAERDIHDAGQVSVVLRLHDESTQPRLTPLALFAQVRCASPWYSTLCISSSREAVRRNASAFLPRS